MIVYQGNELVPIVCQNLDFQSNRDSRRSTSNWLFTLGYGAVSQRSIKQSCIIDCTIDVEYATASKGAKEVVWLRKFMMEIGVVPMVVHPMILFYDNSGEMA